MNFFLPINFLTNYEFYDSWVLTILFPLRIIDNLGSSSIPSSMLLRRSCPDSPQLSRFTPVVSHIIIIISIKNIILTGTPSALIPTSKVLNAWRRIRYAWRRIYASRRIYAAHYPKPFELRSCVVREANNTRIPLIIPRAEKNE